MGAPSALLLILRQDVFAARCFGAPTPSATATRPPLHCEDLGASRRQDIATGISSLHTDLGSACSVLSHACFLSTQVVTFTGSYWAVQGSAYVLLVYSFCIRGYCMQPSTLPTGGAATLSFPLLVPPPPSTSLCCPLGWLALPYGFPTYKCIGLIGAYCFGIM